VNTIRLPLKLTAESWGLADNNTGGMLSLGPPEGGTMLAQPVGTHIQNAKTSSNVIVRIKPFLM
jgi:hypothetical protein